MTDLPLQSRKDIVRGQVTDYATSVSRNNTVSVNELVEILKEIANTLENDPS